MLTGIKNFFFFQNKIPLKYITKRLICTNETRGLGQVKMLLLTL